MQHLLILLALTFSGPSVAATHWTAPNKLGLETAMAAVALPIEQASVLLGQTIWRSDPSGVIHPHGSIEWRGLQGREVLPPTTDNQPTRSRYCQTVDGHDPVPGDRQVHLYRGNDEEAPTTMVLGTAASTEVLLVSLKPGDTLQVTQVTNTTTGRKLEHISLERGGEALSLTRSGKGVEACYASAS